MTSLAVVFRIFRAAAILTLLGPMSCGGGGGAGPPPPAQLSIAQIRVVGQPVKVFDHTRDKQEPYNIPDAQISAWKEANGTVNLMVPHLEAYRMRGPDLLHLTIGRRQAAWPVKRHSSWPVG